MEKLRALRRRHPKHTTILKRTVAAVAAGANRPRSDGRADCERGRPAAAWAEHRRRRRAGCALFRRSSSAAWRHHDAIILL